jgi:hypothetical protein
MNATSLRKKRLEQLLDLARTYKGCTRRDLARALGRDPTKLVPGTGVPKLDLVIELARALDWPVGEVVAYLWDGAAAGGGAGGDFEAIDRAALDAHQAGKYQVMLGLARRAQAAARSPEERARAWNREAGAWDGLGRFADALRATQRGLQEPGVPGEYRRMLQSNLGNAHYCLWSLVESGSVAQSLLAWYAANPPRSDRDRKTEAFAEYVAGHTFRRLIELEPREAEASAAAAARHLERARDLYRVLAAELVSPSLEGIASTCHGGLIEAEAALGRRTPESALAEIAAGLEDVRDVESVVGDRLESYGWWCIFGCNVALRHLAGEREVQQHMAVFTNKADEVAERLDNWSMRERVFALQYARRVRAEAATGVEIPVIVDDHDIRVIAGTMGRFPSFRETGWKILECAQVVNGK